MNEVLARWNVLETPAASEEILACCGSKTWVQRILDRRPFADETSLLITSDVIWQNLDVRDWLEAFKSHPRIGELRARVLAGKQSASWSIEEQKDVAIAGEQLKIALAEGNHAFEEKFGYIFIVCATGKSPGEILAILQRRLQNGRETELREAAEEQRQIMQLRLKKWLGI